MTAKAQSAAAKGWPGALAAASLPVDFGREICGSLEAAEQREWLVTNNLGGYASGTVEGLLTRRYHGLLVAALRPPLGRTLLVTKLDEIVRCGGRSYPLGTNRWADASRGTMLDPQGYRLIERFRLEGTTPVWTFACAEALVEKRVWMQPGANTTYVRYELVRGGTPGASSEPIELALKVLVNYRDFHASSRAGSPGEEWQMEITPVEHGLCVMAREDAAPFYLLSASATAEPACEWYRRFDLAQERSRGLDDREDHLHAATFRAQLVPGQPVTLVFSTEPAPSLDGQAAWQARVAHEQALLEDWVAAHPQAALGSPAWVRQLVLAADQFIVRRPMPDDPEARSVIAGYHWFGDWGRDTMIALPGLTLSAGRPDVARKILRTFAGFLECGMLPNVFPETPRAAGYVPPEYNTVDATLWFVEALRQAFLPGRAAPCDIEPLHEFFPVLAEIVDWHVRGTRYHIRVDPDDGLLAAGEPGVQLTWMDAKVGGWVVTPRMGKPVEVNALWYNALLTIAQVARALRQPAAPYENMAKRVRDSFQRFWNDAAGYCFDVLDGPEGNDASLRPNQILAVSLSESPLTAEQQRAVVDVCARRLLTSCGLRSLAPDDPRYRGHCEGPPSERDAAYHQGTAWGWLLGPFVLAHLRVYNDPALAASFLEPMAHQVRDHGLGSLSEIFDGDAPFTPRGCIAQAWTVAEVLRAWLACREHRAPAKASR